MFYNADDAHIITELLKMTSDNLNFFSANVVYHFLVQIKNISPEPNS